MWYQFWSVANEYDNKLINTYFILFSVICYYIHLCNNVFQYTFMSKTASWMIKNVRKWQRCFKQRSIACNLYKSWKSIQQKNAEYLFLVAGLVLQKSQWNHIQTSKCMFCLRLTFIFLFPNIKWIRVEMEKRETFANVLLCNKEKLLLTCFLHVDLRYRFLHFFYSLFLEFFLFTTFHATFWSSVHNIVFVNNSSSVLSWCLDRRNYISRWNWLSVLPL